MQRKLVSVVCECLQALLEFQSLYIFEGSHKRINVRENVTLRLEMKQKRYGVNLEILQSLLPETGAENQNTRVLEDYQAKKDQPVTIPEVSHNPNC